MDERQEQLKQWVAQLMPISNWQPLNGDASFRRYFRVVFAQPVSGSIVWIAVDSPPAHENQAIFLKVREILATQQLPVPEVLAEDSQLGFMLLNDLGDQLLLASLNDANVDDYYQHAFSLLKAMQSISTDQMQALPKYDAKTLLKEMQLFDDWFITQYLQLTLTPQESQQLIELKTCLVDNALKQPQVFVHRDFHSRNLMLKADQTLALIDFQDAVVGPITYDAISLLKDAYIAWPQQKRLDWIKQLHQQQAIEVSFEKYQQWFDFMGLQRHLKVLGIFARLKIRDNKPSYEQYLPVVLNYVVEVASLYPELHLFKQLIDLKIRPRCQEILP